MAGKKGKGSLESVKDISDDSDISGPHPITVAQVISDATVKKDTSGLSKSKTSEGSGSGSSSHSGGSKGSKTSGSGSPGGSLSDAARKSSRAVQAEECKDDCFKVVQMTSDPCNPCNNGIVGYVYTYKVRQRHRIVKKGIVPSQPYQIVLVKDCDACNDAYADRKLQKAKDDMAYADELIANALLRKKMAEKRLHEAEEDRYRDSVKQYGGDDNNSPPGSKGSKKKSSSSSGSKASEP